MLPYQEKTLAEILSHINIIGADILEIGGAPPWTVAHRLIELGARSVTTLNYRHDLYDQEITASISFKNLDARYMASRLNEKYDLIFGIAVLEHLPMLERVLREAASLLNPGGIVALHGGAFWSNKFGHHVFVHIEGTKYEFNGNNPVDDWSHLYFDQEQMYESLMTVKGIPESHAKAIVEYVYKDPILNRYHYEDIINAYSLAGFTIKNLRRSNWGSQPKDHIIQRINQKIGTELAGKYSDYTCGEMLIIGIPDNNNAH
jgi:trans-aconitate methyltransferase